MINRDYMLLHEARRAPLLVLLGYAGEEASRFDPPDCAGVHFDCPGHGDGDENVVASVRAAHQRRGGNGRAESTQSRSGLTNVNEMQQGDSARSPRLVSFYLPQFHPTPENDRWWGPGFTEWRSVVQATPRFRGHWQPHLPTDLGFYDLRVPETRALQAELALAHGISAFCYYHYWFDGRRLLGRPFDEMLSSGQPDMGFCLCWANEAWTRAWDGGSHSILVEQRYSEDDDRRHMEWMAPALTDRRYLRVGGKPVLLVYRVSQLPDPARTADVWREEAHRLGIGEILLCRVEAFPEDTGNPAALGFDRAVEFQPAWRRLGARSHQRWWWRAARRARLMPRGYRENWVYDYDVVVERLMAQPDQPYRRFPCVMPFWDNSARRATGAMTLRGSTPGRYEQWLRDAVGRARRQGDNELVFVNAWNEWAEGCHLEPDARNGRAYLEATRRVVGPALPPVQVHNGGAATGLVR